MCLVLHCLIQCLAQSRHTIYISWSDKWMTGLAQHEKFWQQARVAKIHSGCDLRGVGHSPKKSAINVGTKCSRGEISHAPRDSPQTIRHDCTCRHPLAWRSNPPTISTWALALCEVHSHHPPSLPSDLKSDAKDQSLPQGGPHHRGGSQQCFLSGVWTNALFA